MASKAAATASVIGRQPKGPQRSPTSVPSPPLPPSGRGTAAAAGDHGDDYGDDDDAAQQRREQRHQAAAAKQVVTPPPKKRNTGKKEDQQQHPDMVVQARIIDELLLVCGVIGSSVQEDETFVPVTDCLEWLQDLQRVLKRDHETYRPISLLLGKWNVVSQKLLPLVAGCGHDRALVLTACKILVLLTKPISEEAKKAGRMVIDVKSGKVDDDVIREQQVLRDNAVAQSDLLMEYKRLFVRHASHRYAFQTVTTTQQQHQQRGKQAENKKGPAVGLLSTFASLLAEPLSKTGSSRTSADHLAIELVLHLIRNLLAIAPVNNFGSAENALRASQLHRELLIVLREEMVLDVLVCLGQEVGRRENQGYNLLLMEILSCLLRGQDPSDVAHAAAESAMPTLSAPVALSSGPKRKSLPGAKTPTKKVVVRTTTTRAADTGSLRAHLQSERNKLQLSATSRHSHFGGTLMVTKADGRQSYVSATDYLVQSKDSAGAGGGGSGGIAQPVRRKNRKAEVFIGSGKSSALHSRPGASTALSREVAGPIAKRAKLALNSFLERFIEDCYGPVTRSLKDEFRRDSSRLEDGDRSTFFRIAWFFHQWWRVRKENGAGAKKEKKRAETGKAGDEKDKPSDIDGSGNDEGSAGNLIFTMDVFTFNLVLNSTDEYFEHRKHAALAQTVALYGEMIHTLRVMYDSDDLTERTMALGLMDRLFYAAEPLDRLPKLLSRWSPGVYGREYLCDLVECTHVMWRLLDDNAKRCLESLPENESEQRRPKDAVERMNLTASEFDGDHYFLRKFVSNQTVFMYTQLLSQYSVNAARVNRHIVAYLIRLCKFVIKTGEGADLEFDALGDNKLAARQATFEPILYNVGLLSVLDKVLNDLTIRDNPDYDALLMFASSFMKRFARAAEENPVLFVEALFKHPIPHRFCELSANMYVNEELRMIAVRDLLLEDQRRYEGQEEVNDGGEEGKEDAEKAPGYKDDEEEELEFNGDVEDVEADGVALKMKRRRKLQKIRKRKKSKTVALEEDQDDSEEEKDAEFDTNINEGVDPEEGAQGEEGGQDEASVSPYADLGKDGPVAPDTMTSPSNVGTAEEYDHAPNSQMSGKKRIRKSQEAAGNEDSDDEDFSGQAASAAKPTRRVIFEDDDDE